MTHDWVQLHDQPIDAGPVVQFVADEQAGGMAVFLGTTRAESSADGKALVALEYEAYGEMALQQMRHLAADARRRWPVRRLALLHRTGRVPLAQPSVIIAVSTPHRVDAFTCSRWLIDTLKAEVAIWKKEIWADGSQTWVEGEDKVRG